MTTITAVQLRKDLDKFIKRAAKGESIRVTYRGNTVVTIGPDLETPISNSAEIFRKMREFHARVPAIVDSTPVSVQDDKDAIHRHWVDKYGK